MRPLSRKDVSVQIRPPDATLIPSLPHDLKEEPRRFDLPSPPTSEAPRPLSLWPIPAQFGRLNIRAEDFATEGFGQNGTARACLSVERNY